MRYDLSLLISFLALESSANAIDTLDFLKSSKFTSGWPFRSRSRRDTFTHNVFDVNRNGSTFVWLPQDDFSGKGFFDNFAFFTGNDPTNGRVNYVDANDAFANRLAYVQDDGIVVMKGDNNTWLQDNENRKSVRISSFKQYNTGLFILDVNRAPWGCGRSTSLVFLQNNLFKITIQGFGPHFGLWEVENGRMWVSLSLGFDWSNYSRRGKLTSSRVFMTINTTKSPGIQLQASLLLGEA
ncbi:hypothetical protein V5O48_010144 [Marasmius crinis-equi]|uniref:Uncharacterized protein n=1 Tax=Marasmius crinis-equi TaxID=585013 RepID=A0ABR3F958_9AGAR